MRLFFVCPFISELKSSGRRPITLYSAGLVSFLALVTAEVPTAVAQQQPQQKLDLGSLVSTGRMHPAPVAHLYMNFLLHQNHLDRLAADRDTVGKNGNELRRHSQAKLGFDESEMATIRATGSRLETELRDIGSRAVAIAKANRAARAAAKIEGPVQPDPRLQQLTREREETIQREMENLNRDLGPVAAAKLGDFIQNRYREHSAFRAMLKPHAERANPKLVQPRKPQEPPLQAPVNP